MNNTYLYSESNNSFYIPQLEHKYKESGSWPKDLVSVSEADFLEFSQNPKEGKYRKFVEGVFTWVNPEDL